VDVGGVEDSVLVLVLVVPRVEGRGVGLIAVVILVLLFGETVDIDGMFVSALAEFEFGGRGGVHHIVVRVRIKVTVGLLGVFGQDGGQFEVGLGRFIVHVAGLLVGRMFFD